MRGRVEPDADQIQTAPQGIATASGPATVLFVCTGNAGRSQLAEAFCALLLPDKVIPLSAGVRPWKALHPMAVRILNDRGIDSSALFPKGIDRFVGSSIDVVVTIGDPARAGLPGELRTACRMHWDIDDPADADGTDASEARFREVAQEIERRIGRLVDALACGAPGVRRA